MSADVAFDFDVRDKTGEEHHVRFEIRDCNLTVFCNCAQHESGQLCEHTLALMTDDARNVISGNHGDVRELMDYLPECDVWPHLERLLRTKRDLERIAEEFATAKAALERAMRD